ncbi:tetratricopeptide repeat protein [Hymenobacter koreensis]|uniref:tetratricopeptide repeat protein n=1 Tax=Hymenobacter koreensis TaxID=1084523 RepID=UPI0031E5D4C2
MSIMNNDERLLDLSAAAYFLRITPELLAAYVRNAPKKGHNRRLVTVEKNGQTLFRRGDLEAFDAYLREPWSVSAHPRPGIPDYIVQYLGVECGGKCARCGEGFKLETAHIEPYATSLSHHHHNLIRLCSQCHSEFDDTRILPPDEIRALKDKLIEQLQERSARRLQTWPTAGSFIPTPSPTFIGRDSEVSSLVDAIKHKRILCIQGPAGIGKTQLALNALGQFQKSTASKVVWLEIETITTIADLKLRIWSALTSHGIQPTSSLTEVMDEAVGLMALDGVEAVAPALLEELEDFFSHLISRTRLTKLLFTSQVELLSIEPDFIISLQPLSETSSADLLKALISTHPHNSNDDANAILRLLAFSDGHPLTIKIIEGLLRFFKSARVVGERVEKYGAAALINPTRKQQTKATSLEVCLAVAYEALCQEERNVLFLVSHCPAGCLAVMLERPYAYGLRDSQAATAGLSRWNLIYFDSDWAPGQRLLALSPIRAYIQQQYKDDVDTANALFLELANDLAIQAVAIEETHTQRGDVRTGFIRFNQEFLNFNYIFDESAKHSKVNPEFLQPIVAIASAVQTFCFLSGLTGRGIEIMRVGAAAAVQSGNLFLASELLLQLISLAMHGRHSDQVQQVVSEITHLANGSTDVGLLGNAAMARGLLAKHEGHLQEAEQHYIEASAYFEQPRPARTRNSTEKEKHGTYGDERMLALSLMDLAFTYEKTLRQTDALEMYQRALSLMFKTKDNVNYGSVLNQMGNCYSDLGEHEKACEAYTEASIRFYDIQASIHIGTSLGELGYLLLDYIPNEPVESILSSELLESGLIDVGEECARVFHIEVNPLPAAECIRLIRKVVGISILVSFTPYSNLLEAFSEQLRQDMVKPLLDQYLNGKRDMANDGLPLMHLDIMSSLIYNIWYSCELSFDNQKVTIADIELYAELCYRQGYPVWQMFRLYDWVTAHLSRRHKIKGLTASVLQEAIENHFETGTPFTLPMYPAKQ